MASKTTGHRTGQRRHKTTNKRKQNQKESKIDLNKGKSGETFGHSENTFNDKRKIVAMENHETVICNNDEVMLQEVVDLPEVDVIKLKMLKSRAEDLLENRERVGMLFTSGSTHLKELSEFVDDILSISDKKIKVQVTSDMIDSMIELGTEGLKAMSDGFAAGFAARSEDGLKQLKEEHDQLVRDFGTDYQTRSKSMGMIFGDLINIAKESNRSR